MSIIQAIILGIVQGLTEFLPVSSSGHLLVLQKAMGVDEVGLTFDVALHIGTLVALLIYFHKDIWTLFRSIFSGLDLRKIPAPSDKLPGHRTAFSSDNVPSGTLSSDKSTSALLDSSSEKDEVLRKSSKRRQSHLAWFIALATIPAAVLGYLLESRAESTFRSPTLVAINLSVFGLVMLMAEKYSKRYKQPTKIEKVSLPQAMAMGFAQAIAIIPGVSRSGSTITAGLFAGLDRVAATRFSFLLGVPIIAGAALKVLVSDTAASQISDNPLLFIVGIVTSFITGLIAIRFMLGYLSKHSLAIFAYYRFALAAIIIIAINL
jgi:undecaprenyl-diphosphatase